MRSASIPITASPVSACCCSRGIGDEARGMGIDQGFAFASASDRPMRAIYDNAGGQTSGSEVLYGFRF